MERQRGQESALPMLWSSDWMERMVRDGSCCCCWIGLFVVGGGLLLLSLGFLPVVSSPSLGLIIALVCVAMITGI